MTDYTQTYTPQTPTNNKTTFSFVLLLLVCGFLVYAVQNHLITQGFIELATNFFDNFNIHTTGIQGELFLLTLLVLAWFGLFCLVKFFLIPLIGFLVVVTVLSFMFSQDTGVKPTLKDTLIHDNRAKSNENIGG